MNQRKNTYVVSTNKKLYKFETFDIKEFYPSIKEFLLKKAINFTKQQAEISKKDKEIIFHTKKSLLFNDQHVWIKKEGGFIWRQHRSIRWSRGF